MVIIDLKKASDREPTDIILQVLDNKKCPKRLYCHHKYMYDGAVMSVRTSEETDKFLVTIGLHKGSALSPHLFVLTMGELTVHIQKEVPLYMLFTDHIVLVDELRDGGDAKLERW